MLPVFGKQKLLFYHIVGTHPVNGVVQRSVVLLEAQHVIRHSPYLLFGELAAKNWAMNLFCNVYDYYFQWSVG